MSTCKQDIPLPGASSVPAALATRVDTWEKLQGWGELCRQHSAARSQEDIACMAITTRLAVFVNPTREELDAWHAARERTVEVEDQMSRYASAAFLSEPGGSVS